MQVKTVETGDRPKITIDNVGGRLRLRSGEAGRVEARGPEGSEIELEQRGERVRLRASGECQLLVPADSHVEAETIGGEAWVIDFPGELLIRTVGGSLRLKRIGSAAVETIGGSLAARRLSGGLSVDRIGGDALVDQVAGDLRLRSVGGDMRLSRAGAVMEVSAGGDGKVSLLPTAGTVSSITVGGDLTCHVAEAASVVLRLKAGGDLRVASDGEPGETPDDQLLQIGAGEAEVALTAGGDLSVRSGAEDEAVTAADLGEAIAMRVGAELETHMAEIEERLSGLGDRLQGFDSDRIGRKIRESIARAQRRAARAQRRAARRREVQVKIPAGSWRGPPSDEERLMILRMLEQRKISVDEAESLLKALEH